MAVLYSYQCLGSQEATELTIEPNDLVPIYLCYNSISVEIVHSEGPFQLLVFCAVQ